MPFPYYTNNSHNPTLKKEFSLITNEHTRAQFHILEYLITLLYMDATIALLDGGGGGSHGAPTKESKVEKDYMGMGCMASEVSSYQEDEAELELGLGLSLGGSGATVKASAWGDSGRILTAKDFPSSVGAQRQNKSSASIAVSGTKRAADSAPHVGGSPPSASQVVGWPPIGQHRMNSLVNQAKAQRSEDEKRVGENDKSKEASKKKNICSDKADSTAKDKGQLGLVKVYLDGVRIGRKVDLTAHASYEALAQTIENMFFKPSKTINLIGGENESSTKLLDGSSDFVLTYEDKEGDLMLVGDVPWGMFLGTARRLRIMKTSEANGLAPAVQETNQRPRGKPIL